MHYELIILRNKIYRFQNIFKQETNGPDRLTEKQFITMNPFDQCFD